eukprot:11165882-Lingulodinium_polyedra.AAC.1
MRAAAACHLPGGQRASLPAASNSPTVACASRRLLMTVEANHPPSHAAEAAKRVASLLSLASLMLCTALPRARLP